MIPVSGSGAPLRLRRLHIEPNTSREADYLRRAVKFLLSRSQETSTNVNARLFNYSLLTTLKPPARPRLSA